MRNSLAKTQRIDLGEICEISDEKMNELLLYTLINDMSARCQDKEGLTPLLRAAKNGLLSIAGVIIETCPESVVVCDFKGRNVLHLVHSSQDYEQLHRFVSIPEIITLINVQDSEGNTPAHLAVMDVDQDKLQVLADLLADFSVKNNQSVAVEVILRQLYDPAQNTEAETKETRSKRKEAQWRVKGKRAIRRVEGFPGIHECKNSLFTKPLQSSILRMAIQNGNSKWFEEAIEKDPSLVLRTDSNGDTALHIAARSLNKRAGLLVTSYKDYVSKVEKITEQPIKVYPWRMKNLQGYTPFQEALRTGNSVIALDLINLDCGFWLLYKDDSETPLHMLARDCINQIHYVKVIEQLVKLHSWAIFQHDADGLTPLMRAAKCGNMLVALLILMKYPQAIEIRDESGKNFLHHLRLNPVTTVREYAIWMCKFLIRCSGVDDLIFSKDHKSHSPLQLAFKECDFDVVSLLMQRSLEIMVGDLDNLTIKDNDSNLFIELLASESSNDNLNTTLEEFFTSESFRDSKGESLTDLFKWKSHIWNMRKSMDKAEMWKIMDEKLYNAARIGDDRLLDLQRPVEAAMARNNQGKDGNYYEDHDEGIPNDEEDKDTDDNEWEDDHDENNQDSRRSLGTNFVINNEAKDTMDSEDQDDNIQDDKDIGDSERSLSATVVRNDVKDKDTNDNNNLDGDIPDDDYFQCRAVDGSNILHIAIQHGHKNFVVKAFSRFPMLMHLKDSSGDTPLHIAARITTFDAASILVMGCRNWWHGTSFENMSSIYVPPWKLKNLQGNTFLHEAARTSNLIGIYYIHEYLDAMAFCDVNNNRETPLHLFARCGIYLKRDDLVKSIQMMIPSGSSACYMRDIDGLTPAARAVKSGRIGIAIMILEQHPQLVDVCDYTGKNILHLLPGSDLEATFVQKELLDLFEQLLMLPGVFQLLTKQDKDGNTPTHLAIKTGNFVVAKFLLERSITDVNLNLEFGVSLFVLTNNEGHSIITLIELQIDMPHMKELKEIGMRRRSLKEFFAITNIMEDYMYKAIVEADMGIFDDDNESSTESSDVEKGIVDMIFAPTSLRNRNMDGSNIIHITLQQGKQEGVEFMEKAVGLFPDLILEADLKGDTPLHLAARLRDNPVSERLLSSAKHIYENACRLAEDKAGAEPLPLPWTQKNNEGNMPIHEALRSQNAHAVKALLDADPEGASHLNDRSETPLHLYARWFHWSSDEAQEILRKLIYNDPNVALINRDIDGLIPLSRAAMSSHLHTVLTILTFLPQSAYLTDRNGRTFLHLLQFDIEGLETHADDPLYKNVCKNIFQVPEVHAQMWTRDNDGNTPLHYAMKSRNFSAVELLTYGCPYSSSNFNSLVQSKNNDGEDVIDLIEKHKAPQEVWQLIKRKCGLDSTTSLSIYKADLKERAGFLLVIAGLLATVTFAAVFQVPGGFNGDDGTPTLSLDAAYKVFLVADTLAMCGSMVVLFCLLWLLGYFDRTYGSFLLFDISMRVLQASFYATLVAFMTAVYVTTAHKTLWLAIFVCVMCSIVILVSPRRTTLFITDVAGYILVYIFFFKDNSIRAYKSMSLKKKRLQEALGGLQPRRWQYDDEDEDEDDEEDEGEDEDDLQGLN